MKLRLCVLLTGFFFAHVGFANDGNIYFQGAIIDNACEIEEGSGNQFVDMGAVSVGAFSTAGDKASPTAFNIHLQKCPRSLNKVSVKFDGDVDDKNPELLKLIDVFKPVESSAGNIGIEIAEDDGTPIPLHSNSKLRDIFMGKATLPFVARYVSTGKIVKPGIAFSSTQFTINYQ